MSAFSLLKFSNRLKGNRGIIALMAIHVGLLGRSAVVHAPTQDEVAHLPAGLCVWKFGDFSIYRVNPPLVRTVAAIPILFVPHQEDWKQYSQTTPLRQEWALGRDFIRANNENALRLFVLARWFCIPFSLLGMWVCYRWASDLFSHQSGLIAASLWCFSPNVIGHGSIITPDVAAVSMGLLAAWRFSIWQKTGSAKEVFLAGISLGLALLTKTYWITLIGIWPVLVVINSLGNQSSQPKRIQSLQLIGILLLGLNVLNLGYGFQGSGTQLKEFDFYSRSLSGELRTPGENLPGNRFAESWLGSLPVPLPRDYVTGIDLQKVDFEEGRWSFFCGEVKESGGWWQYYLVGLLLKVPLGTWLLFISGLWLLRDQKLRAQARFLFPLILPAVLLLLIASSETGMNRHIRYVFPVLPVLYITGSIVVMRWKKFCLSMLLYIVISSLWVYPHSLSYFNESIGGPNQGCHYLIDSNLDWGQDLLAVKRWLEQHPEKRPAFIGWAGDYSPRSLGVDADVVPIQKLKPGWYFISRSERHHPNQHLKIFQSMQPIGQIAYTFDIYRIDQDIPIQQ